MDNPWLFSEINDISKTNVTLCLNEYAPKIKWSISGGSVIDLGFGDGSVSCILKKYIPENYKKFYACDVNPTMVEYANEHHGDQNITFIVQDVTGELPEELKSAFDNVFSFFLFHWIQNQEKGFQNVFKLLKGGGECLLMFFGYTEMYHVYDILGRTPKWKAHWLQNVDTFLSPYYNVQDPVEKIKQILEDIGFSYVNVECKKITHSVENALELKKMIRAVDPHNMPDDVFDEFFRDFFEVGQSIDFIDKTIGDGDRTRAITQKITFFVVHAGKLE